MQLMVDSIWTCKQEHISSSTMTKLNTQPTTPSCHFCVCCPQEMSAGVIDLRWALPWLHACIKWDSCWKKSKSCWNQREHIFSICLMEWFSLPGWVNKKSWPSCGRRSVKPSLYSNYRTKILSSQNPAWKSIPLVWAFQKWGLTTQYPTLSLVTTSSWSTDFSKQSFFTFYI